MKKLLLCLFGSFVFVLVFAQAAYAATFVVDSTGDGGNTGGPGVCDDGSGDCTLRAAIEAANATAGADAITFSIPGAGVHTFTPTSGYPNITEELSIDGFTQPGAGLNGTDGVGGSADCGILVPSIPAASNTPHTILIEIDGTSLGWLWFDSTAANSVVRGLNMHSGPDASWIHVINNGANDMLIECNYFGTDPTGSSIPASPSGTGVSMNTASTGTVVQNNLMSGYLFAGSFVIGEVTIQRNLIGTDATGTTALANKDGIVSYYNTSDMKVNDNIIAGNSQDGINNNDVFFNLAFEKANIQDNSIGRNLAGSALGNTRYGIFLKNLDDLTISGNTIAQNGSDGINIKANDAIISGNTLSSNTNNGAYLESYGLGTDSLSFSSNLLNSNGGLGASINVGNAIVSGNTATSNTSAGITVSGDGNAVSSNTTSTNGGTGLEVTGGAAIASTVSDNSSSDNAGTGILASGSLITVSNNTSSSNDQDGMFLSGSNDTISDNEVINNSANGMSVGNMSASSISHNYIGVDSGGATAANGGDGIFVQGGGVTIGGSTPAERNFISANDGSGIHLYACGANLTTEVIIIGNYIGTNISGDIQSGYGNGGSGVQVNEEDLLGCGGGGGGGSIYRNQIGGDAAGQPNTIAGNNQDGIRIYQAPGMDVFSNAILPNIIFGNSNLGINLAADETNDGVADAELGPNIINSFLMGLSAPHANYYLNHPVVNATPYSGNQIMVNYSFQANQADNSTLFQTDVVGYRLDFYLNDVAQDGAYAGYNQSKVHLGSFIVNGSETNANHTFTSPVSLTSSMNVNATATVLWKVKACEDDQQGNGPPYSDCGGGPM